MRHTHTHTFAVLEIENDSFEDIAQRLYDGAGPTYFIDGKIVLGSVALMPESLNVCDTCGEHYAPLPPTWKHECPPSHSQGDGAA